MRPRVAIRWVLLIATLSAMGLVAYMMVYAQDEANRSLYLGMFIGLLVALPSQLDSLHFLGEKEDEVAGLDKKLTEVYSPIHAMIVAANKHAPAATARTQTAGNFVPAAVISNLSDVSRIFHEHGHDLGNHNLDKWIDLEREIVRGYHGVRGFYLGQDRQAWFDELEAEYQRQVAELKKLK